ncbi:DEAD/DEAH box helicase [Hahella aquimaris]|uniref:DEAD/DEAH box helicase n=1 Tax=Hahella sp. HNIBRBA332 TaxID=3015983 RepID=UPI00273AAC87|nr:DEAD/DEAH box helicase [Hahella sp. HNIBRBA332]WLQ16104.1 DEAD/DEAH box helicase [Hahella sp. HNIBRBA332]
MSIREFISKLITSSKNADITWKVDLDEGLDFIISHQALTDIENQAVNNPMFGIQYAYLKGLHEEGVAQKNASGYTIPTQFVAELDDDFCELFQLPRPYPGLYRCRIEGNTGQAAFHVSLDAELPDGGVISDIALFGPFLKFTDDELYRLSPPEWQALNALEKHAELPADSRNEYENNWLIFQLQLAKKAGVPINLAHFNKLEISYPESIGVAAEVLPNGDLFLTPSFGANIAIDDIKARLGQLPTNDDHCLLRIKNRFVLLDNERLEAAHEILTSRHIPKEQVATFLKSPTAYLNAALIDLDTGFSLRVHGAEKFSHRYFGDIEKSGIDWFAVDKSIPEPFERIKDLVVSEESLAELNELILNAKNSGAELIEYADKKFDISDTENVSQTIERIQETLATGGSDKVPPTLLDENAPDTAIKEQAVVSIDSNDEKEEFVSNIPIEGINSAIQSFATDNLKRSPYPHQSEGIKWLLAHMDIAIEHDAPKGALLADDMGLGKTYMALVAISEWHRRKKPEGKYDKPVLIVATLSLLENWQAEVNETFIKSPFNDIVILQSGSELSRFKIKGSSRETQQVFEDKDIIEDYEQIRYSLKVGGLYGPDRLDMPRRLVLTTYQTLRDYQFSLSRVDWSAIVFDEAQNIKNPNALATRAAKGLKADFKLLATGTPVENTLKDFWCLMDTAVPGLLGAWQTFREEYISPITSADSDSINTEKLRIGKELRDRVGDFMLRRTKEEKLPGMPEKTIYSGDPNDLADSYLPTLSGMMSGAQLKYYDEVIASVHDRKIEDKRRIVLPSLLKLKIACIHHDIGSGYTPSNSPKEFLKHADNSIKIRAMLDILKDIEKRQEKVLVFATSKAVQAYTSALITTLFKIQAPIVNGDTKAVATPKDDLTRKAIIDRFQAEKGFRVLIMSPIAAGVGLTVVGANNVIHLERHWNPAKEAQATDRVYRIGQKKNVYVYLPMALHPNLSSFDIQLNTLLNNKVTLSDAVVAPTSVQPEDFSVFE